MTATPVPRSTTRPARRRAVRVAAVASAAVLLTACTGAGASDAVGGAPGASATKTLNVYAFSVARPAIDALAAAYATTPEGSGTTIQASYGASGDQSRKVAAGAPADLVAFSLAPDVTRLVGAGLVAPDWAAAPTASVFGSVVVFVVHRGNPHGLRDWDDLLAPGISVVTPNPLSSGSAQWNLLAPYAAASRGGQDPQAGLAYVTRLVTDHVRTRPGSAAEATESFRQGTGDVLLSYENEALAAIAAGDPFEIVVPPQTFRIENATAPVATGPRRAEAERFLAFAAGPAGQEAVARAGYRPADAAVAARHPGFATPQRLWTVADLGGWPAVTASLFDKDTGAITRLYASAAR